MPDRTVREQRHLGEGLPGKMKCRICSRPSGAALKTLSLPSAQTKNPFASSPSAKIAPPGDFPQGCRLRQRREILRFEPRKDGSASKDIGHQLGGFYHRS